MMSTALKNEVSRHMEENHSAHVPVMSKAVFEYLQLKAGDCFVDGTLGLGGHAAQAVKILGPQGRLIGIDRDEDSLVLAQQRLKESLAPCDLIHDDYRNIDTILMKLGIQGVDGILLDLGISSFQLDNPERGFSLKSDGPLDMRMDKRSYISAYDLVNSLSERELSSILKNFGQERWHNRIARFLVQRRSQNPIESTQELTDAVLRAIPYQYQKQKIHPATRTFQAIRIAVNRELEALEIALERIFDCLKINGRIGVISFHSLEDRIVKEKFRNFAKSGRAKIIFKKPLRPQEEEINNNPRSRSARFRVAERIK